MGKGSSPPPPPDPAKVAGAQTAQNVSTSIAQGFMNNINQVTPYGSLVYDVTGNYKLTDPNTGNVFDIPTWTATQNLSPIAQRTTDANMATGENLAKMAWAQSARVGDHLSTPLELSNEAAENRLMELGRKRLDPALDRRRETELNRMTQQGIMPGSKAYDRAMSRLDESGNDAYNQLMLAGRGQAMDELLTQRNQPINETTALMSGAQVQQPRFVNTNPAQLANVDRAGLEMDAYGQRMNAWQAQQAQRNSMMGGLFGLAGNIIKKSDRRIKRDVVKLGEVDGLSVYEFSYLWDDMRHVGYMAQEVQERVPEAVIDIGGVLHLDYAKLPAPEVPA